MIPVNNKRENVIIYFISYLLIIFLKLKNYKII